MMLMTTNKNSAHWPFFILALVSAFVVFSWWSFDRAASGVSPISDPDYYAHGLKYHSSTLDAQTAASSGWSITPRLEGRTLTIKVADSRQNIILGCQAVIAFPSDSTKKSAIMPLTLSDIGNGHYSGTLPEGLPPSVSATLTLSKNQATTQRQILINQES